MEIISRETLEQNGRIIHDTEVDIGNKRPVVTPIHIVQYDNTLPVIAVKIYKDGNPHKLPSEYSARIRWKTANGIRYEAVMGRSDLKPGSQTEEELFTTLYFTVDVDMTRCFGELNPIIEVSTNNMLSGSSPIPFVIHRNPIQESEIENEIEKQGVVLAPVATSGSFNDLQDKPPGSVPLYVNEGLIKNETEEEIDLSIDFDKVASQEDITNVNERVDNITPWGRELSGWDSTQGKPTTEPPMGTPYAYKPGDYYIIEKVGTTNYKPTGTQYTGERSTTVETDSDIKPLDVYRYDGSSWYLIKRPQIDLTNYFTKQETRDLVNSKVGSHKITSVTETATEISITIEEVQ